MKELFEPKFVESLFDDMCSSYSKMNYITSFGFSERWRRQCVEEIKIGKGKTVVDLMTGMGECWKHILKTSNEHSKLIALDFSTEMINRAENNKKKYRESRIEILKENVFDNSIPNGTADYVISGFGLKTFNDRQLEMLAIQIHRILKPNGKFSLIDISIPKNKVLKIFFSFYLKKIIPILGNVFLGNPETYKMLGVYTERFNDSKNVKRIFKQQKFSVEYVEYFFGCATGIKGKKIS